MVQKAVPLVKQVSKEKIFEIIKREEGVVTRIAKSIPCEVLTFYRAMNADPEIKQAVDSARELWGEKIVDLAEQKLEEKIIDGDNTCTIFALKTKGKNRGWAQERITQNFISIPFMDKGSMDAINVEAEKKENSDETKIDFKPEN